MEVAQTHIYSRYNPEHTQSDAASAYLYSKMAQGALWRLS